MIDTFLPDATYRAVITALASLDHDPAHPHPLTDRIGAVMGEIGGIWPVSIAAVKVEVDGVEFGGTYRLSGDMITVTGPMNRTRTTQTGGSEPSDLAEMLLREIVREAMGTEPDGLDEIPLAISSR